MKNVIEPDGRTSMIKPGSLSSNMRSLAAPSANGGGFAASALVIVGIACLHVWGVASIAFKYILSAKGRLLGQKAEDRSKD
jgi:hypothetical protein